jgi:hypothetical protein
MVLTPLFNAFSFSRKSIPPLERAIASMGLAEENHPLITHRGSIGGIELNQSESFELRWLKRGALKAKRQPRWLKRIAMRVKREFPGGFPPGYAVYAALFGARPGAEEQEVHADGPGDRRMFWNIFVPLTFHAAQGTTVFPGGVRPSPRCRNYMFDSTVLHHGEANRSGRSRWALLLTVASADDLRFQAAGLVDV